MLQLAHERCAILGASVPFMAASAAATLRFTAMKLSGLTGHGIDAASTRNSANSGWSLGAWPHNPTLVPDLWASRMTLSIIHFTASSCSSNSPANLRSRSTPSVAG